MGDQGRLRQVLVNLVGNAVKFTVARRGGGERRRGGRHDDELTLRFSVRDTGIGIDETARGRIFQAFSQADTSATRQFGGTGLGLAISAEIVQMMGGRLTVDSAVGEGSTFTFTAGLQDAGQAEDGAEETRASLEGKTVLIVDDHEATRATLVDYVRAWGARPVAVDSAKSGIEEAQRAQASGRPFDVVLAEVDLAPMDGPALAAELPTTPGTADPRCC